MGGLFGGAKAPQAQKQQPAGALNVQTSIYGSCYPLVYGKNRLPINLIHYVDFKAIPHTEKQKVGGKGAGSKSTSNTTYTYTVAMAAGISVGGIKGIGTVWKNKEKHTLESLGLLLFDGAEGQVAWSYLTASFPSQAVPYANLAYIASPAFDLQDSPSLPNINVELKGLLPYDEGVIDDAEPSAIVDDYCTNPRHGAGFNYLGDLTAFSNYCRARGLFLSPMENNQRNAGAFLKEIADVCNTGLVYRNAKLDFIPFGDTEISGNGATYTPDLTPEYDLTVRDFLFEDGQPPVKHAAKSPSQQFNHLRMEYNNRANDYNPGIVEVKDQADIDDNGLRTKAVRQCKMVTSADVGRDIIQHEMQRDLFVVNTYSFRLGVRHSLLEPMDYVTITEPGLGLDRQLVRIIETTEQDDALDVVAEEMNVGVANAPRYDTDPGAGYNQDFNIAPGSVLDPLTMNAPGLLTDSGYETWIAVCGPSNGVWGGAIVWVSEDDITYRRAGEIFAPARYGTVAIDFEAGTVDGVTGHAADTFNTIRADLYQGQMISGTDADVDEWRTLLFVGGEWIAYKTATFVNTSIYDLTTLNRGGYGSLSTDHFIGEAVAVIDEAIFRLPYDRGNIGKQVYFKFTSFNVFGGGVEDLADVVAYSHVLGASELTAPIMGDEVYLNTVDLAISAGVLTVDCSLGNQFRLALTENVTDVVFVNVPPTETIIIEVMQTGTFTFTFPDNCEPVSNVDYVPTQTAGVTDIIGLITFNKGIKWSYKIQQPDPVEETGVDPLGLVLSPNPASATSATSPVSVTVTASATGGSAPYTYLWQRTDTGTNAAFTTDATNAASITFSRTSAINDSRSNAWQCTVTDAAGRVKKVTVTVTLTYTGDTSGTRDSDPYCVSVFAWVITQRGEIRARDVVVGDMIRCVDPLTGEESWEEVTHSEKKKVPGLMYATAAGVTLTCSNTAKLPVDDGSTCEAQDIFYKRTFVKKLGSWLWSLVLDIVPLGDIWVQHISCKEKFFLAGDVKGEYCAHHNLKYVPELDGMGYRDPDSLG